MKTLKQTMVWAAIILVCASGCKKYEEGPGLSFRSKQARMSNNWKIEYAFDYKDTLNVTADYLGETWELKKDGTFTERDNGLTNKVGNWKFKTNNDSLQIMVNEDYDAYFILKLKENEIWLRDKDEEIHLAPAK